MKKRIIAFIAILMGTVALGLGQTSGDWTWQLSWIAKGKIVGNVEIGVGGGACDLECPPPFLTMTPPPTANCNIPYQSWSYTLGPIQTRGYGSCNEIASFHYAFWTRPCCGSGEWTRRSDLFLGEIAPEGFCTQPPPQVGQGIWHVPNILECP